MKPRWDPIAGNPVWDAVRRKPMAGCGCCEPGCACTAAVACEAFSDCTPCSLSVTFNDYTPETLFGPLSPNVHTVDGDFFRIGQLTIDGVTYEALDATDQDLNLVTELWVTIDPPTSPICVVGDTCGFTSESPAGSVQLYTDSGGTSVAHLSNEFGGGDVGDHPPFARNVSVGFSRVAPSALLPTGSVTVDVFYAYGGPGYPYFGSTLGFLGELTLLQPSLSASDFPLTVYNTNGTGGGTVTLDLDCCGSCSDCPSGDVSDPFNPSRLVSCCNHFLINISGLSFTHGWDVYQHFDDLLSPMVIDGWESADQQARVYCTGGKWRVRVTDKCNELGFGSTAYIEWETDGPSQCPPSLVSHYSIIHNDFGGSPVLNIGQLCGPQEQCPAACNECCATYNVTLAGSGCAALNTDYVFTRGDDWHCGWSGGGGNGISCEAVNGQWVMTIYGTVVGGCAVGGYIEFRSTMYDATNGSQARCPSTVWVCTHNDFGSTTGPTVTVTTADCGCPAATCDDCHDVYTFALVSRELSVDYTRSTLHTGGDDVPCKWDEIEPFGFGEVGDQYGSIVRDEGAGVWRLTYSDDGDPGFTATAPLEGNPCPPTDIEAWTVGGGEAFSSITFTDF